MTRSSPVRAELRQRGAVAVETVCALPVVLAGTMLLFEIVRVGLVVIIGNLAVDTALAGLRNPVELPLDNTESLRQRVKSDMLSASYGYLSGDNLTVRVTSYPSLAEFGVDKADGQQDEKDASKVPVLVFEVRLTQDWITSLPALLGIAEPFSHTYQHVSGSLSRQAQKIP